MQEVEALRVALVGAGEFHPGEPVRVAFERIREVVPFMQRDRAMDTDVARMCELVASGTLVA